VHEIENNISGYFFCKARHKVDFPAPDGADITIKLFIKYFEPVREFFRFHFLTQQQFVIL